MSTQSSTQQPDGFSERDAHHDAWKARPFQTNDATGPVLVHVETSGPLFANAARVVQRDQELTALVEPMARMLYRAMQIQALGAIDAVAWEDLSVPAREQIVNDARQALHLQSPLYREKAETAVKHEFQTELRNAAYHFPDMSLTADAEERRLRSLAVAHVVQYLELLPVHEWLQAASRRVLTEPLKMASNAQIALTAMRGARP